MRTLKQIGVPHDENTAKFPQGTIQNETDTQDGTPVVREVYGDILTNIYKILERTGLAPTGSEDAEDTQYQIVQALDLWANNANDILQLLTVTSGNVWQVNLPFEILPDKYVFIAMAGDDFSEPTTVALGQATIQGLAVSPVYDYFPDSDYKAGDFVLVIVNRSGVVAVNLSSGVSGDGNSLFVGMGSPLSYGENSDTQYETDGILVSNKPSSIDIQAAIGLFATEPDALILDMIHTSNKIICYVRLPIANEVRLYEYNDVGTVSLIIISGFTRTELSAVNEPYMYCDGLKFYFTNNFGEVATNEHIAEFLYDIDTKTMTFVSENTLSNNFSKTTNVVIKDGFLYTFISSGLRKYNLLNTDELLLYVIPNLEGQIFKQKGKIMFSREESSVEWVI